MEDDARAALSGRVAAAAPALEGIALAIGTIDLLLGRVAYARRYGCVVPEIGTDASLALAEARFLPLEAALAERDRRYVPISIDLAGVGVLTGANMGGKSAALGAIGFAVASVALGVPLAARSGRIPLVAAIAWLGAGAAPERSTLLSAFGGELVALRDHLARDAGRTLVLVDEFARTTSPREGGALLAALVRELAERGDVGLATTHFAGIARGAGAPHYAIRGHGALAGAEAGPLDLATALDRVARRMDYRVVRVADDAGDADSGAFDLAVALGLDASFVARARAALAREDVTSASG